MNRYVVFAPIIILILTGTSVVSPAFAATTITINTDKDVYDHTDIITVTGTVFPVDVNEVPVTILIVSPKGGIADIAQLTVNDDGSFSTTFDTSTSLMKDDGIYQFRVTYVTTTTTILVELTNAIETSDSSAKDQIGTAITGITGTTVTGPSGESFYELSAGQVEYDMTCDAEPGFFANADDASIVIYLEPKTDGIITLTLHEELIKPFEDGTFAVIINNQEMEDYTQVGNTLTIPCLIGTEKIEIHGSWAIPEFGVIAAMILAIAIVSIIVVTAKTRLSIVPRY